MAEWLPVCTRVISNRAIQLPSAQNGFRDASVVVEEWQRVNIVHTKCVADIEDGIAPVEPWHGLIAAIPFTGRFMVRAGRTAVPGRAVVDSMAPRVMRRELQPASHSFAQRNLHGVVNGVVYIFPDS